MLSALALLSVLAGGACREDASDDAVTFAHLGLGLTHPAFLDLPAPVSIEVPLARAIGASTAHDGAIAPAMPSSPPAPGALPGRARDPAAALVPYHVELRARHLPALRLEIYIDRCPPQPRTALALARSLRHGASLVITDVHTEQIAGRSWQRTRFSHRRAARPEARPEAGSQAELMTAVEYATVSGAHVYRVTAYGPPGAAQALAERVAPTLRLDAGGDSPRWHAPASSPDTPEAVTRAAAAVVAVVAADIDTDSAGLLTIRPVAMGSGVTIDARGHVLTSAHTLHDEQRDALHDLFFVGHERAGALVFVCAGRPAQAALDRELDLALIRCALDPDGSAFATASWHALATTQAASPAPGERLWVLGRAETDDGALAVQPGRVMAASSFDPDPASAGLVTIDVPVTHGMSGGAVVDEHGALLGVVQGFRERFHADHAGVRRTGRIGLVRLAAQAQTLIEAGQRWPRLPAHPPANPAE